MPLSRSSSAVDAAAKALVGALGHREGDQIERAWASMDEHARDSFRVPAMEIVQAYLDTDDEAAMPADLQRVLRDGTIIIGRDHEIRLADGRTLAEHLQEWRDIKPTTASADLP